MIKKLLLVVPALMVLAFFLIFGGHAESLFSLMPGIHSQVLKKFESPDGRLTAILTSKWRLGLGLPVAEPPKTTARWARLQIVRDHTMVYDSGDEPLNVYQMSPELALDLVWSPDSSRLAYRYITRLRIIDAAGKVTNHEPPEAESSITCFKWIDNRSLTVVAKQGGISSFGGGATHFRGYTEQATAIWIGRLDPAAGYEKLHQQALKKPTFLFHAVDFEVEEISPKGDKVAFSDGTDFCVFDLTTKRIVAKFVVPQKKDRTPDPAALAGDKDSRKFVMETAAQPGELEGLWWQDNDRVLMGVGLMGNYIHSFHSYDCTTKEVSDRTARLQPVWDRSYKNPNWFRAADP
ncbi:MAG: hypothetical protein WCK77_18375 [Verrucomicrobiota bacterium]